MYVCVWWWGGGGMCDVCDGGGGGMFVYLCVDMMGCTCIGV